MKPIPVKIFPVVLRQIDDQVLYIAQHSVTNAIAWEARLRAAIKRVGEVKGYHIDEDATDRLGEKVQVVVFEGTYLIRYRIVNRGTLVEVINFRHGARMPESGEDWPKSE